MKNFALVGAAIASMTLAAACSPAEQEAAETSTESAVATGADAAASATTGVTDAGGVVSPPQSNEAVDTAATQETDLSAGSNSFTESQARGHIEKAGYTGVTGLMKTPEGLWTGQATKAGKAMTVSVDFKGAVSAK